MKIILEMNSDLQLAIEAVNASEYSLRELFDEFKHAMSGDWKKGFWASRGIPFTAGTLIEQALFSKIGRITDASAIDLPIGAKILLEVHNAKRQKSEWMPAVVERLDAGYKDESFQRVSAKVDDSRIFEACHPECILTLNQ